MLIAASSRGIGAATARLAGECGYDVAITYVNNKAAAESVAADVVGHRQRAEIFQADMSIEDDIRRMFVEFDARFDQLDVFVYNAGGGGARCQLADADSPTLRTAIDLNLLGALFCSSEAVKRMSSQFDGKGGNIVFIGSRSSEYGSAGLGVWYAASKNGVNALTSSLSKEVAEEGIRVNAVSPGPIHTDRNDPAAHPERLNWIPMHRYGKPEEVAAAVLFFASPAASFITGAVLNVSGGR